MDQFAGLFANRFNQARVAMAERTHGDAGAEIVVMFPIRILAEQPAIWTVPTAILLMIIVSKATRNQVPADARMKMLVLHAPEALGLKQEYIQEQQGHGH